MAWGGTIISGGIVLDEYNPDLRGVAAVKTADKMRRSDGQVRAVEKVISLPIRSTEWFVEEPRDASAAEKEAANLLRENLFGGMKHSFDDLLRECCLAIHYGWRVPEIVWEERNGLVAIRKVASRNLERVERWLYSENGELAGYLFNGNRPKGKGLESFYSDVSSYEQIPIPIEKTLHLTYDQEGDNPQGFGLWRSMYPHWWIKSALYKIVNIGIERNLIGVPYAEEPEGAQVDEKAAILRVLARLRAAEDGAFTIPNGWEVGWFEATRNPIDAIPYIQHHNFQIAVAGLCTFLTMGQTAVGTQALGSELAKIFELAEEANASGIEEQINQQLVKRWCAYNYGDGLRCPRVKHAKISSRDLAAWTNALNTLATGGFLHPVVDDEEMIRDTFDLPKIERDQLIALETKRQEAEQQKHQAELAAMTARAGGAAGLASTGPVKATEPAGDACQFAEGDVEQERQEREAREQSFSDRAETLLVSIQEGYLAALRPLVEEAESSAKISKGMPLAELADVAVPGARKYQDFVRSFLWEVFREGQALALSETGADAADRPVSNKLRQWISARAAVIAASHVGQLRTAVLERVLTGIRAEMPVSEIFSDAGAAAIEELSRSIERDWNATAAEVLTLIEGN